MRTCREVDVVTCGQRVSTARLLPTLVHARFVIGERLRYKKNSITL